MRSFAREQAAYYQHLIAADQRRKGDYDGRGVLSESGLVEFISFCMSLYLDQIGFMNGMLQMQAFEARLAQMLAAEATKLIPVFCVLRRRNRLPTWARLDLSTGPGSRG
jgi:hypothetical protein